MKKLLLLALLSTNIFAGSAHTVCSATGGVMDLTVNDITTSAPATQTPVVSFKMHTGTIGFSIVTETSGSCIDGQCQSTTNKVVAQPGFYYETSFSTSFRMPPLGKGTHKYSYRMAYPQFGCDIQAQGLITVN